MITITSDKGLIRVDSWGEIASRPGFVDDLNPATQTLDRIIGRYQFPEDIVCGLSNCHHPHRKGYIVVTKEGLETNIGKDCGKTYFGVDFETLSRQFDRDMTKAQNRERLWSFSFHLEDVESAIDELRHAAKGADWAYTHIRPLLNRNFGCPNKIVDTITAMVKARNGVLSTPREATQKEIDQLESMQGRKVERPYYIDEPIARLNGFAALYPDNDLRKLLVIDLAENIREFRALSIDSLSYRESSRWAKWVDTVENTIDKCRDIVSHAKQLLTVENLKPLQGVLTDGNDISEFRQYLSGLRGRE